MTNEQLLTKLTELNSAVETLQRDLAKHVLTEEKAQRTLHHDVENLKKILEQLRGAYKLIVWGAGVIAAVATAWTWITHHATIIFK